jgi:hypothetical protein
MFIFCRPGAVAEDDVTVKGKDKKGASKNAQPPATGYGFDPTSPHFATPDRPGVVLH